MVDCPICGKAVKSANINDHLDSNCVSYIEQNVDANAIPASQPVASFFKTPTTRKDINYASTPPSSTPNTARLSTKRPFEAGQNEQNVGATYSTLDSKDRIEHPSKRTKPNALQMAAPLAERMRPKTLDEIAGQELVGPNGVLRGLIEKDSVPNMILWGSSGTGKTTIARVIASVVGSRFVEINATSSGVGELKKIFGEAKSERSLTSRKTIVFCDEIHRFSKSQQDVFLAPVECGQITLIGATTENPSFKVQSALLSRCRTFTLQPLTEDNVAGILRKALEAERQTYNPSELVDDDLIRYLAAFADGDARSALNLLELAMELSQRPNMTLSKLKSALTKTLVYDRAGDQHYDTISAFHKSVRGSNPDAALYYLARMLQSGEDPRYVARRMVVMASEDVGLADNTLLPLAMAAYDAAEKIGMPEARINLAHAAVALSLAPKSTRSYRGLSNAEAALREPGIAALPIPIHLRNAPTRLMKELGYGKEYKYNPNYIDGKVKQDYLPEKLMRRKFLEDRDLGTEVDLELEGDDNAQDSKELDLSPAVHDTNNTNNTKEIKPNGVLDQDQSQTPDDTTKSNYISKSFSSAEFAQRSSQIRQPQHSLSQPLPQPVISHQTTPPSSAPISNKPRPTKNPDSSPLPNSQRALRSGGTQSVSAQDRKNDIVEDVLREEDVVKGEPKEEEVEEDDVTERASSRDTDEEIENITKSINGDDRDGEDTEFYNEYDSFV